MQNKFRRFQTKWFRPDWINLDEIQMKFRWNSDEIQMKFRENSEKIQIFLKEI